MHEILNLPPIQVKVQDLEKNEIILTAKSLTAKNISELNKITLQESDPGIILKKQMVVLFGGEIEDYERFDIRTLKGTLEYFNQSMSNPTK